MSDLTTIIPRTTVLIDEGYEKNNIPRLRLGLSECGHKCPRYLWYAHKGTPAIQPEGRVLRLFQLGNILEDQTIEDLKSIGIKHHSCQAEVKFEDGDTVLTGHIDGIVEGLEESPGTPHLFEHKTSSLKKYKELMKIKDYKAWNEIYYWQLQFYMFGLGLTRSAAFVYCKDNSELYMERIKLDKEATVMKLIDVFRNIQQTTPPERACPSANWFEARWCKYGKVCYP